MSEARRMEEGDEAGDSTSASASFMSSEASSLGVVD